MDKVFDFDFTFDTQKVFRNLMEAMARPLTQYSISESANRFQDKNKAILALGCTLLDNEVSFYVEMDSVLQSTLSDYTMAKTSGIEEADYIITSSHLNYATINILLENAKQGTLADPQTSATFIIFCDTLNGDVTFTLEGPGVNGIEKVKTTEYIAEILKLHSGQDYEYPCGIDLIFVSNDADIMAFPRLCKIREVF